MSATRKQEEKNLEIVLISHWFGHTPFFMACVVPIFLEKGCTVYHLTDKPEEADLFFQESLGCQESRLHHLGIEEVDESHTEGIKEQRLAEVIRHWKGVGLSLRALFARLGREVGIFHTWVDLFSHPLLRREVIEDGMPAPWTGLYVHPAQFRITKSRKRQLLETFQGLIKHGRWRPRTIKAFNSRFARKIYFYDELIINPVRSSFRKTTRLGAFPDPVKQVDSINRDSLPELKEFRACNPLILSLSGFLSRRKGLLTLIRLASRHQGPWAFLFAGGVEWDSFSEAETREIKQFMEHPPKNTLFLGRKLDDAEFKSVFENSDLVYVAYENFFHSSNVQILAALLGKPILAGPRHLISERTRNYDLGWCLPELTGEAVESLLKTLDAESLILKKRSARFQEFTEQHSELVLKQRIDEILNLFQEPLPICHPLQ